jgi:hypothetical protein
MKIHPAPRPLPDLVLAVLSSIAGGCATVSIDAEEFASAEQAVESLVAALRANDTARVHAILGPGAEEVLSSGDDVADRNAIEAFLGSFDDGHRLVTAADGAGTTLVVGPTDWPLAIPLVERGGRWSFDTEAGLDELLSRRIGPNELDAVQVCLAIVDAQREFAAMDPDGDGVQEYARKFRSDNGKRNGLYWPAADGEPQSPLGLLIATVEEQGYGLSRATSGAPRPYHGYFFRILHAQGPAAEGGAFEYVVNGRMLGGFAVVAHPAVYANSGIKTFLVNHQGVVFETDLGESTARSARGMTSFDPGAGWSRVP